MELPHACWHYSLPIPPIQIIVTIIIDVHKPTIEIGNHHLLSWSHPEKASHSCPLVYNRWLTHRSCRPTPWLLYGYVHDKAFHTPPPHFRSASVLGPPRSGELWAVADAKHTDRKPHVPETSVQTEDHVMPPAAQQMIQPLAFHTFHVHLCRFYQVLLKLSNQTFYLAAENHKLPPAMRP